MVFNEGESFRRGRISTIRTIEVQMTKSRGELTELEGAILGVLRRSPHMTAYAVRRAFLGSLSAEWSGSAGAVYPAIERMRESGLVRSSAQIDRRGAKTYTLTAKGIGTHDAWLCDIARALGPGTDPFRTRAGLWPLLPSRTRVALLRNLSKVLAERRSELQKASAPPDVGDAVMQDMYVELLTLRLKWLERQV
jgi:DNA-binding PadR family transcriptional regulator